MEKNEWSIGLKEIAYIVAFTIIGAYLIYRGVVSNSWLAIVGGAVLLLIGGGIIYINLSMRAHYSKPIEERLTDPVYLELRPFFRKTLLPLGFKEEQYDAALAFGANYTREKTYVGFWYDRREYSYFFQAGSKTKTINVGNDTFTSADPDFSIMSDAKNIEGFKQEVRDKLSAWLVEQKVS